MTNPSNPSGTSATTAQGGHHLQGALGADDVRGLFDRAATLAFTGVLELSDGARRTSVTFVAGEPKDGPDLFKLGAVWRRGGYRMVQRAIDLKGALTDDIQLAGALSEATPGDLLHHCEEHRLSADLDFVGSDGQRARAKVEQGKLESVEANGQPQEGGLGGIAGWSSGMYRLVLRPLFEAAAAPSRATRPAGAVPPVAPSAASVEAATKVPLWEVDGDDADDVTPPPAAAIPASAPLLAGSRSPEKSLLAGRPLGGAPLPSLGKATLAGVAPRPLGARPAPVSLLGGASPAAAQPFKAALSTKAPAALTPRASDFDAATADSAVTRIAPFPTDPALDKPAASTPVAPAAAASAPTPSSPTPSSPAPGSTGMSTARPSLGGLSRTNIASYKPATPARSVATASPAGARSALSTDDTGVRTVRPSLRPLTPGAKSPAAATPATVPLDPAVPAAPAAEATVRAAAPSFVEDDAHDGWGLGDTEDAGSTVAPSPLAQSAPPPLGPTPLAARSSTPVAVAASPTGPVEPAPEPAAAAPASDGLGDADWVEDVQSEPAPAVAARISPVSVASVSAPLPALRGDTDDEPVFRAPDPARRTMPLQPVTTNDEEPAWKPASPSEPVYKPESAPVLQGAADDEPVFKAPALAASRVESSPALAHPAAADGEAQPTAAPRGESTQPLAIDARTDDGEAKGPRKMRALLLGAGVFALAGAAGVALVLYSTGSPPPPESVAADKPVAAALVKPQAAGSANLAAGHLAAPTPTPTAVPAPNAARPNPPVAARPVAALPTPAAPPVFAPAPPSAGTPLDKLFAAARKATIEGRRKDALKAFKAAYKLGPKDPRFATFVPMALGKTGAGTLVLAGGGAITIDGHAYAAPARISVAAGPHTVEIGGGRTEVTVQKGATQTVGGGAGAIPAAPVAVAPAAVAPPARAGAPHAAAAKHKLHRKRRGR